MVISDKCIANAYSALTDIDVKGNYDSTIERKVFPEPIPNGATSEFSLTPKCCRGSQHWSKL